MIPASGSACQPSPQKKVKTCTDVSSGPPRYVSFGGAAGGAAGAGASTPTSPRMGTMRIQSGGPENAAGFCELVAIATSWRPGSGGSPLLEGCVNGASNLAYSRGGRRSFM